jgi:superfamily II DNA helicase RecQ
MEELIRAMPKTIDEMMQVSGFGEAKCAKYGEDLLGVLGAFR